MFLRKLIVVLLKVTKNQILEPSGTQDFSYKAIISDLAGNTIETEIFTVKIETDVPTFAGPISLGADDKGISNSDLFTNIQSPTLTFTSEPNLRVFLDEGTVDPTELTATYASNNDTSGVYTVSIDSNLGDGTYKIILEDDAGNRSTPQAEQTFRIDATPPVFTPIQLINGTDKGVNTTDRYTAVKNPVVTFDGENDLNVFIKYDNGSDPAADLANTKYTVTGGSSYSYKVYQVFNSDQEAFHRFHLR